MTDAQYPATYRGVEQVLDRLLGPDGCPWDREQTQLSLQGMLREECHELMEAIEDGDEDQIVEELGDVLLHLLFQLRLGVAAGQFSEAHVFRVIVANSKPRDAKAFYAVDWEREETISKLFGHRGETILRRADSSFGEQPYSKMIRRRLYRLIRCIDPVHEPEHTSDPRLHDAIGKAFLAAICVMQGLDDSKKYTYPAESVFGTLISKLVRRHPHVFGDTQAESVGEVVSNWTEIKRAEKPERVSILDGVPKSLPALAYAQAIQTRAARLGFDWDDYDGVVKKVAEEIDELAEARSDGERAAEYGDLLFSIVNAARWLDVDAESALDKWQRQRISGSMRADRRSDYIPEYKSSFVNAFYHKDNCEYADAHSGMETLSALKLSQAFQEEIHSNDDGSSQGIWGGLGRVRYYMYEGTHFRKSDDYPAPGKCYSEYMRGMDRNDENETMDLMVWLRTLGKAVGHRVQPGRLEAWMQTHEKPDSIPREVIQFELSCLLYVVVQVGCRLGVDAETALHDASARFYTRFRAMEQVCRQERQDFKALTMDEKEELWQQVKAAY